MKIQYKIKYPNLLKDIEFKKKIYSLKDKNCIENIQLSKLNYSWMYAYSKFNFYRVIKKKYHLPDFLKSIDHLNDFPILNKNIIKENYQEIINDSNYLNISQTGGTSGNFIGFPTNYYDEYYNILRTFYYRQFIHQIVGDKCLYIWGHSHKFGSGLKKVKKIFINKFKDFLNNRIRLNAYDLSNTNLKHIYNKITRTRTESIIIYGSTLEVLIDYFLNNNLIVNQPIKLIVTSDNLSLVHQKKFNKVFTNSILINEFGMAETGILGYSKFNFNELEIFWDDYLLASKDSKLLLSSLNCTCFPLFKYDPEDSLESTKPIYPIFKLKGLIGKKRPFVEFKKNGKKYSTIIFDHILKNHKQIIDFQYIFKNNNLTINYQSSKNLNVDIVQLINNQLNFDIKKDISILRVSNLQKTIAGKRNLIIN